jgi:hypothetical protein
MKKVTFSTNFEARNYPFGPGEGSLGRLCLYTRYGFKLMARFNTFDLMGYGYIGARK